MTLTTSLRRKELEARKSKLMSETSRLHTELLEAQKDYKISKDKLTNIDSEIKRLTPKEIEVSDHALLRYIERFMCFPIEEARTKLKAECEKVLGDFADNGTFPFPTGGSFVIRDKNIVTVKLEREK